MNTFVKALVLSVSTTLVAAPVFAAGPQNQPNQPAHIQKAPAPQHVDNKKPTQHQNQPQHKKNAVKPSRDWRVGTKVPKQYQAKQYHVTQKADKRLSKPNKNQQWLKVNGDYVLTQGSTYSIVKIVRG